MARTSFLVPGAVSDKSAPSIIQVDAFYLHDGESRFLRNVNTFILDYTAAHFR
jgi:hypothetical protein